jgi:hypothetical protein
MRDILRKEREREKEEGKERGKEEGKERGKERGKSNRHTVKSRHHCRADYREDKLDFLYGGLHSSICQQNQSASLATRHSHLSSVVVVFSVIFRQRSRQLDERRNRDEHGSCA